MRPLDLRAVIRPKDGVGVIHAKSIAGTAAVERVASTPFALWSARRRVVLAAAWALPFARAMKAQGYAISITIEKEA
jgi:hypothetical protein